MTQMITGTARELRAVMDGPVIEPGDLVDDGRRVWNAGSTGGPR